ncbi:MAG: ankyrin repeat domain-containing protein [Oligoflexia bacterium]|nr:ankyrin repeat domain-containing protein [Oligoflexia bacterium]
MKHARSLVSLVYILALAVTPFALKSRADYYPSYGSSNSYGGGYGGFNYGYGRESSSGGGSKMVSLEMDQKKILNSDFRVAAREDRLADMKRFLKSGADVNSQSETGETALMYASRQCSLDAVRVLLNAHAKASERDNLGRDALMYAVMNACTPVVELLLKDPTVLVDAADESRHTALDYSAEAADSEVDGPSIDILHLLRKAQYRRAKHHASSEPAPGSG